MMVPNNDNAPNQHLVGDTQTIGAIPGYPRPGSPQLPFSARDAHGWNTQVCSDVISGIADDHVFNVLYARARIVTTQLDPVTLLQKVVISAEEM